MLVLIGGLLTYPVFSALLLVLAGLLIGYALIHPFRADTSGISEQLELVQQQNGRLQAALDEQRRAYVGLEQKHREQQHEWEQVRNSQLDLTTAWNKFGQNYSQVSAELKDLQKLGGESAETVKHERAERLVAEKALLTAEDKIDDLAKQLQQQDRYHATNKELTVRLDEAHAQIERLTTQVGSNSNTLSAELESLRTKLANAATDLEKQRTECSQLNEALTSETRELRTSQEEIAKLRGADTARVAQVEDVGARRKQVQQLETERDEARASEHKVRRELERYKSSTLDRDRELDRLRNRQNRFDMESKEVEMLRQRNAELAIVVNERDQLQVAVAELSSDREAALAAQQVARATMEKIEKHTNENRKLKQRCDQALADLQRERLSRQSLESKVDETQEELGVLRQRCLALRNADEQCAALKTAIEDDRRRLQQVTIERDAAFAAESAAKEALERHHKTATDPKEVDRVRQQREEVLIELETVRNERDRLGRAIRRQEEQITSLQALCCRLEAKSAPDGNLAGKLADQAERLRKISLEHELNSASLGQAEQTIAELRQLLGARESTINGLQRERDEALRRLSSNTGMRFTESQTRIDPRLGLVYVRPPAERDDLKLISGVSEVLEQKLNSFGIFRFDQLVQWDDLAITEFSKLLSFKDRIQRENWIGQARRLHERRSERAA